MAAKQNSAQTAVATLLAWYDRARRDLPWRAAKGKTTEPYRVWLSEIMLQQTTVAAVIPYYHAFLRRWPTVKALARASQDDVLTSWAGLGYYSRARNLHACARLIVENFDGEFPCDEAALRKLPGVGPYTAAAIAAIAFNRKAAPVDGNIERVLSRYFAVDEPWPEVKPKLRQIAEHLAPEKRSGDFAQAMMDLGATICTPKSPNCGECPWSRSCRARVENRIDELPRRPLKKKRPLRRGHAYIVLNNKNEILLERRPQKGLLAGMMQPPMSAWEKDFPKAFDGAPADLAWVKVQGVVTHTFTHFDLELKVFVAFTARKFHPAQWVSISNLDGQALPTVMRKAIAHGIKIR